MAPLGLLGGGEGAGDCNLTDFGTQDVNLLLDRL